MDLNENCCRLCLKDLSALHQSGEGRYYRIAEHRALQLMILNCFEILITDDEAVTKICSICKDEVHQVNTIRKKVQEADCEIRDFYQRLQDKDEIEDLDKPPEKPIIVSSRIEPELVLESDNEKKIGSIVDDSGGQNSKHEINQNRKELLNETNSSSDSDKEADEIDAGYYKPVYETEPVKPKFKTKKPKIRYSDYRCFICSTDFANQDELNSHWPTHVDPNNSQTCSICNQTMLTVRNLNLHLRRTHFRPGKKIPCEECRKNGNLREFASNQSLEVHKKIVHEGVTRVLQKNYVCSHCGKKFVRASALRIHENTHTRAESYPCSMCSSRFASKASLCRHETTHLAEKPYVCNVCGIGFRQSFNMQMHKANRHSDDRPFGCEICGARFKVKMALTSHARAQHGTGRKVKDNQSA